MSRRRINNNRISTQYKGFFLRKGSDLVVLGVGRGEKCECACYSCNGYLTRGFVVHEDEMEIRPNRSLFDYSAGWCCQDSDIFRKITEKEFNDRCQDSNE